MKKKAIILLVIVVCVVLAFALIKIHNKKEPDKDVLINNWNDKKAEYPVCKIYGEIGKLSVLDCKLLFETEMSMEEIIETNKDAYVTTEMKYFYLSGSEAAIFFNNNNYYYVLEQGRKDNCYRAGNLCAQWSVDGFHTANIRFPFPEVEIFEENLVKDSSIREYFTRIFDNYSFEYMKDFYSRISSDLCTIDEENQTITIKAYANTENISWDSGYLYEIVIDCKNRSITGPMQDGGTYTLK